MGRAADACCIQYRMLNRGKGSRRPSLRAQADRRLYQQYMKHALELQDGLEIKQAMVTKILCENGAVSGLQTQTGAEYQVKKHHHSNRYLSGQHHHYRLLCRIFRPGWDACFRRFIRLLERAGPSHAAV